MSSVKSAYFLVKKKKKAHISILCVQAVQSGKGLRSLKITDMTHFRFSVNCGIPVPELALKISLIIE